MTDKFYRYGAVAYDNGTVRVICTTYPVIRLTPKGCWVGFEGYPCKGRNPIGRNMHFILNTSRKKYAYPTKEEALQGFIARQNCRMNLLRE
jgi:hypothetical protein